MLRAGISAGASKLCERALVSRSILLANLREHLEYDSRPFRAVAAAVGMAAGRSLLAVGSRRKALQILTKIHRSAYSDRASRFVERLLKSPQNDQSDGRPRPMDAVYRDHIDRAAATPSTARFFEDPSRLLGARALVLKSPGPDERGVLLLDYNFTFPLFAKLFDIGEIAGRYYLVLEPGWSGYCTLDILCYTQLDVPVFVQAYEPRDAQFIRGLRSNLVPVPLSTNWWVDHRVMRPLPGITKDVDVIMLASWAGFKRHARLFAALGRLRAGGRILKTILVGYPADMSRGDIERLADHYGVRRQLEIYEHIGPEAVNLHLNRSKVNVVWSRREGVNRAMIEGMLAGIPCILRRGFNYGHPYPYVNDQTGCVADERELPAKLLELVNGHRRFSPRAWVLENMSCLRATEVLNDSIREVALRWGESWTRDIVVKTAGLNGLKYWQKDAEAEFAADYASLRAVIRPPDRVATLSADPLPAAGLVVDAAGRD